MLPAQARALTYTFANATFSFRVGNANRTGTISGSFDFDGTAISNFSSIEVSTWNFNGPLTPTLASYSGSTTSPGNLRFTGSSGPANNSPLEFLQINNIQLSNTVETISLTGLNSGSDGAIGFCLNPGCPPTQFRESTFAFSDGTLTSVPLPLSPVALTPLALAMAHMRRRYHSKSSGSLGAGSRHPA